MLKVLTSLALTLLASLVLAECDLLGGGGAGATELDPALCRTQGAGTYTFGMSTSLTGTVPTGPTGGQESTSVNFRIMDNTCKILGVYTAPSCGIPYTIKANFLQYVLIITSVDEAADSGAYFSFKYANGEYSIGNNGCVCNTMSSDFNAAAKGCRCAFPVAGQPMKRGITFEA